MQIHMIIILIACTVIRLLRLEMCIILDKRSQSLVLFNACLVGWISKLLWEDDIGNRWDGWHEGCITAEPRWIQTMTKQHKAFKGATSTAEWNRGCRSTLVMTIPFSDICLRRWLSSPRSRNQCKTTIKTGLVFYVNSLILNKKDSHIKRKLQSTI